MESADLTLESDQSKVNHRLPVLHLKVDHEAVRIDHEHDRIRGHGQQAQNQLRPGHITRVRQEAVLVRRHDTRPFQIKGLNEKL